MKRYRVWGCILAAVLLFSQSACGGGQEKPPSYTGGTELTYEIMTGSAIPYKINEKIFKEKEKPFQFTYRDQEWMYIALGYGQQPTGGYSIRVAALLETAEAIVVETELIAPEAGEVVSPAPSCPYLVLKTGRLDKSVRFLGTPPKE